MYRLIGLVVAIITFLLFSFGFFNNILSKELTILIAVVLFFVLLEQGITSNIKDTIKDKIEPKLNDIIYKDPF